MGFFSFIGGAIKDFLNPLNIVPTQAKKIASGLANKTMGFLGFGAKSKKNSAASQPKADEPARAISVKKGKPSSEKKKRGILPAAVSVAKDYLPSVAAGVTLGYAAEKIAEGIGIREGAGFFGKKPSELQMIGNGKKAPAPKKKRAARKKPKRKAVKRKRKGKKRKAKRRKKVSKRGKKVSFMSKGKRVTFYVKPKKKRRKAKRRKLSYRAKSRKHQKRPKGVSKTELKKLKALIRKYEKD